MSSYPYIGDHPVEPPEDNECPYCDGFGFTDEWDAQTSDWQQVTCLHCQASEMNYD